MQSLDDLDTFHLEVFQEVGNIGAGNAATALAHLINKKVDMDVPKAGVLLFEDLMSVVGSEEDFVICIQQKVTGEAPSGILFILEEKSAYYLADLMFSREPGTTVEIDEMEESLFKEVGNILSGSFLSAFSQITGLTFQLTVPALARDMLGAVISSALVESGYYADRVLVVETRFHDSLSEIRGHFFILPEIETLTKIFAGLGINL